MEKTAVNLEKDLISHLAAANMKKEYLSEITKSLAAAKGFQIVDWWILGIPAFEQIIIQGQLPVGETDTLTKLLANERFKGIDILRKGIPKPDFFQVNLRIDTISTKMPQV